MEELFTYIDLPGGAILLPNKLGTTIENPENHFWIKISEGIYEPIIDLFEEYELQPPELQEIINRYNQDWDNTYENCAAMLKECEAIGYTFEYYLDAEPYALRPKSL